MKGKTKFAIIFFGIIGVLLITSCGTSDKTVKTDSNNAGNISQGTQSTASMAENTKPNPPAQRTQSALFTGDGGKGIVIAVPAPVLRGAGSTDSYIPQFFQDIITGSIAKFSAMTVLDRANESLAIAEQKRSETGFFSDNDMVEIGKMTNARYIVAGSIQNTGGMYAVSFRINNSETNEIQASFNERYGKADMESGKAAREAVRGLLADMGVELTVEGERTLLAIQPVEVRAVAQLARGMEAEKKGDIVEALGFLMEARNSNTTRTEANRNIQSFFVDIPTNNIRERANYAQTQKAKWDKIFADLDLYMRAKLPVFIYDFSIQEDTINIRSNEVSLNITPGIKVIPNVTALSVYKQIVDEWIRIEGNAENKDWVRNVRMPKLADSGGPTGLYSLDYAYYEMEFGLYDSFGDRIAQYRGWNSGNGPSIRIYYYESDHARTIKRPDLQVLAQHKYYYDAKFFPIRFNSIPLSKITDIITPKIDRVYYSKDSAWRGMPEINFQVMTVQEYQEWLSLQWTAR